MINNLRIPPHNVEAEQAVLSAMLINPQIRTRVADLLSPDDFYREAHALIYDPLRDPLYDAISLYAEMESRGITEKCGGKDYLFVLAGVVPTSAGWEYHANIVKDRSNRRKLIQYCQITSETAFALHEDLENTLKSHHKALVDLKIMDPASNRGIVDISNVYTPEKSLQTYSEYISKLKKNRFITGIQEIDRCIRGISGGELLFLIARGGTFKTAILQNLLKNYVNHSAWGAAFFSIEMPVFSITERYHEIIQGSEGKEIEEFYTSTVEGVEDHREQLEKIYINHLKNLYIIDACISLKDIRAYTRLIESYYHTKIGVVGIDYLGLMDGEGRGEYEIVSNLARGLKTTARNMDIPVICICQTSRKGGAGNIEFTLDMGRGSGAIEEAADFVFGFWEDEKGQIICKIAKNRKGPKGISWILDLDKSNLRLGNTATYWEPPKKQREDYD